MSKVDCVGVFMATESNGFLFYSRHVFLFLAVLDDFEIAIPSSTGAKTHGS